MPWLRSTASAGAALVALAFLVPPPADADRRGTSRADVLKGTPAADRLLGRSGNDRLSGGAGNDHLAGGHGNDRLSGGRGNDRLLGGLGADVVAGGPGRDRVEAGPGNDRIDLRDGRRDLRVKCGRGRDRVRADARDVLASDCEKRRPVKPAPGPGGPGPGPTPGQTAGPGNAAVAVYQVRIQGLTFRHLGLNLPAPDADIVPIAAVDRTGYLVYLLGSQPGLNGPAEHELALFSSGPATTVFSAGTLQFAGNTLFFTVANLGNPSLYVNTPYPYDLATVQRSGSNLRLTTSPAQLRQFIPPFGHPPSYFHTRDTSFADVLKGSDSAIVELRFSGADDAIEGAFEVHGGHSPSTFPPSEYGRFGYRAAVSGTRISAPGGVPIYLPVPKPTIPRPPGCRIELKLEPNINTGLLEHRLLSVCT